MLNDEVIDLGVSVYVLKDNSPDAIRAALLAAADGRSWFSRSLTDFILNRQEDSHTLRKEVAGLDVISKTERPLLCAQATAHRKYGLLPGRSIGNK